MNALGVIELVCVCVGGVVLKQYMLKVSPSAPFPQKTQWTLSVTASQDATVWAPDSFCMTLAPLLKEGCPKLQSA